MRVRFLPLRLIALATASTLALASARGARAAPPPIPLRSDPPSLVGRLARITGSVSFHTADADKWSQASVNLPLISGDALWTEPGARADLQFAVNHMVMAPGTELQITTLDDQDMAMSELQGETYLNLRQVRQGASYTVQTYRGLVQITVAGRYGVVAGDAQHPTIVTVVDGGALITGPNLAVSVGPRQSATLAGAEPFQGSVGPMTQDAFLTTVLAEERPVARATVPIPPLVAEMTGAEDLDEVGRWQETPQYGTIWYPPVQADWVPYRDGHWSYVAPWGWTWVDNAPWGFAPFHYGRWVRVDQRWGWIPVTPGAVARAAVYAPALVSFLAAGAAGLAARPVGWVPLGPREPYYPPYRANLAYVRNLNATSVQNVNQTISTVTAGRNRPMASNFINRSAATSVPAATLVVTPPEGARPPATHQTAAPPVPAARPNPAPTEPPRPRAVGRPPAAPQLRAPPPAFHAPPTLRLPPPARPAPVARPAPPGAAPHPSGQPPRPQPPEERREERRP